MEEKFETVDLLIDGRVYRLSTKDPGHLTKVAGFLNSKISECRDSSVFRGINSDLRNVLLALNLVDDIFREKEKAGTLQKKVDELEKENYALRHDIVNTKMKLETLQKDKEQLIEKTVAGKRLETERKGVSRG